MEKQNEGRQATVVIQDAGLYFPYNFFFRAKYNGGFVYVEASHLDEYCKEFKGKTIEECLNIFEQNHNCLTRTLKMNSCSEPELVEFSIDIIEYSSGIDDVKLEFEQYLALGCPNVINIERHISSADSLEKKLTGGKQ